MKTLIVPLCLMLAQVARLAAQTPAASPTPPLPPLLKRAPDSTQWIVTYQLQPSETKASGHSGETQLPSPATKTVMKIGGVVREKTIDANGLSSETWCMLGGQTVNSLNGKDWVLGAPGTQAFDSVNYSQQDFAGFDWITSQNFIGQKSVNGRRCLVFRDRVLTISPKQIQAIKDEIDRDFTWIELDENGEAKPATSEMQARRRTFNIEDYKSDVVAYIDDETRLPVALVYTTPQGAVTRTYQFQALSTPLVMPAEVRKLLEAFKMRQKRLNVSRAPI